MKATQQLKDEHEAILMMLKVMEKMAQQLKQGQKGAEKDMPAVVDFLRGFADRCHHGKEEEILFPAMEGAGIPRNGGPIGVMLHEHDAGRSLIKDMSAATSDFDPEKLAQSMQDYIELLRTHIHKENEILFKMADQHIPSQQQEDIYERFEVLEEERMGAGQHEEYHRVLKRMAAQYGA